MQTVHQCSRSKAGTAQLLQAGPTGDLLVLTNFPEVLQSWWQVAKAKSYPLISDIGELLIWPLAYANSGKLRDCRRKPQSDSSTQHQPRCYRWGTPWSVLRYQIRCFCTKVNGRDGTKHRGGYDRGRANQHCSGRNGQKLFWAIDILLWRSGQERSMHGNVVPGKEGKVKLVII